MSLLNDLFILNEADDYDSLPSDVISELQKNIRDGAKDREQLWANALELVHKAYEVAGVQRPTPDLKNAWKQYEENLTYAVQQLAKERGMQDDWRMSSAVFREAMEKKYSFRVVEMGDKFGKGHTVEAKSLDEVIASIKNKSSGHFDVKVAKSTDVENPRMATLSFSKWGIKRNYRVKIQQL